MIVPRRFNASRCSRQRGQALTEFLVIALALVPVFLLVPVIAKYQDIAHMTQMASRYAAFDVLVRNASQNTVKPIEQLEAEVRRRFFSNSDAPIKTGDVAGDFKAHQNLSWRDPVDRPLIENFSDVTVVRSSKSGSDKLPAFAYAFGATGISTATVKVKLSNLPSGLQFYEPFDKINLSMSRGSSVLADGWTGKSPEDVEGKFGPLVPATRLLPPLSPVLEPTMLLVEPGVTPPNLGMLGFWRDVVPADRLVEP